jgi:Protein of unknown function (DUF2568)
VTPAQRLNLVLRVTMWRPASSSPSPGGGSRPRGSTVWNVVLGLAAPAAGLGLWGLVDFRRAGRWAEPLRLTEELAISGAAAAAWYAAGQHALAWALAGVSIAYHALVYLAGERLLAGSASAGRAL